MRLRDADDRIKPRTVDPKPMQSNPAESEEEPPIPRARPLR
jgi:hypothetical protein